MLPDVDDDVQNVGDKDVDGDDKDNDIDDDGDEEAEASLIHLMTPSGSHFS